ncbi:MAG: hypothetical protein AAFU64_17230, partial [Bacteroidota bacterium]
KGKQTFIFEPNTFSYGAGEELTDSILLRNPENLQMKFENLIYNNTIITLGNNGFYISPLILTHPQEIYLDINVNLDTISTGGVGFVGPSGDPLESIYLLMRNQAGDTLQRVFLNREFVNLSMPKDTVSLALISLSSGEYELTGDINICYEQKRDTLLRYLNGGGVRIKEVHFYNEINDSSPARSWQYSYEDASNSLKSSGAVDGVLGNLSTEYEMNTTKYLFSTEENAGASFLGRTIRYVIKSQGANAQLTKGGYVAYKTVKVKETGNGYRIFTYTSAQDFPNAPSVFNYPFTPAEDLDFKRGLLLKEEVFNESNQILSEVENFYQYTDSTIALSLKVVENESCQWLQFYDTYSNFRNNSPLEKDIPICGMFPCIGFDDCGNYSGHYALKDEVKATW